ncbi:MAG: DUF3857 domain-containing protein [Tannerella sp.]|jgi:hypothetical protein|nr:DUF3857 domain-containing protein [Tannerella sp.]
MKKYIFTTVILMFAATMAAQPEAVFNRIVRQYTLNDDGSASFHYRKELTLNDHIAFNSMYGETFIVYNPDYQEITVNESYTVQADGTKIETPANAITESLPPFASDAPAYNHLRELIVAHTGLEVGATIYLDYTVKTKAGFQQIWSITETLQERMPVKISEIDIVVPQGSSLNFALTGIKATPEIKANRYSWRLKNIPATPLESFVPQGLTPRIYASTGEAGKGVQALVEAVSSFPIAGLKKFEGEDVATQIQKFVVSEIAYSSVPQAVASKVRPPSEVISSAYGTLFEKTALMIALMKANGISGKVVCAYPAGADNAIAPASPTDILIKVDDKYLSAVRIDSKEITSIAKDNRLWEAGFNERSPYQVKPLTDLPTKPTPEQVNYRVFVALTDSLATIEGKTSYGASLEEDIKDSRQIKPQNGYLLYSLPANDRGVDSWHLPTLYSRRTQPFELPTSINEVDEYEIALAANLQLRTKPFNKTLRNSIGEVRLTLKLDGQKVGIHREIALKKTIVSPSEYTALRELILLWQNTAYRAIAVKEL